MVIYVCDSYTWETQIGRLEDWKFKASLSYIRNLKLPRNTKDCLNEQPNGTVDVHACPICHPSAEEVKSGRQPFQVIFGSGEFHDWSGV